MSGLRVALVFAGLLLVLAGAYVGARFALDAAGVGGSAPEDPRPGIRGIVAVPVPRAPAGPAPSSPSAGEDLASGAGTGSGPDTASSNTGGEETQAPVGGETVARDEASEGGTSGGEAPTDSGSSQPPPPQSEEPEEPTVRRNPGK